MHHLMHESDKCKIFINHSTAIWIVCVATYKYANISYSLVNALLEILPQLRVCWTILKVLELLCIIINTTIYMK